MIFKLDKHKTNIVSEAKAQRSNGPYVTDSGNMNNGGINLLEYIMKDSLGVYNGEERSNKYLPEFINQVKNKENIIPTNNNDIPVKEEKNEQIERKEIQEII